MFDTPRSSATSPAPRPWNENQPYQADNTRADGRSTDSARISNIPMQRTVASWRLCTWNSKARRSKCNIVERRGWRDTTGPIKIANNTARPVKLLNVQPQQLKVALLCDLASNSLLMLRMLLNLGGGEGKAKISEVQCRAIHSLASRAYAGVTLWRVLQCQLGYGTHKNVY